MSETLYKCTKMTKKNTIEKKLVCQDIPQNGVINGYHLFIRATGSIPIYIIILKGKENTKEYNNQSLNVYRVCIKIGSSHKSMLTSYVRQLKSSYQKTIIVTRYH